MVRYAEPMNFLYARDLGTLFLGDLVVFAGSLWLSLYARHFVIPTPLFYLEHLIPFAALFAVWCIVFLSVGLYDRTVALFEQRLPLTIFQAQVFNLFVAIAFFFLLPVEIQPKTILALYFVISTALIVVWRLGVFRLRTQIRGNELAVVVGAGTDIDELVHALRMSPHTSLDCVDVVNTRELSPDDVKHKVTTVLAQHRATVLIVDPRVQKFFEPADFPGVFRVNALDVYESIFSRTPLTLIDEQVLMAPHSAIDVLHDTAKRVLDVCFAAILFVFLMCVTPIVYVLTRIEGAGPLWISQERIGRGWKPILVYKLRTMTQNDAASGVWVQEGGNRVTRVGAFLRRTSIDELPQLFSVLKGQLSFIGPRSDIRGLGERLREEIPLYYGRYQVTPGISGWAQVNQRYAPGHISPQSIDESRVRLQYDLYYVRHRSFLLDLMIIAKTVTTVLSRLIP